MGDYAVKDSGSRQEFDSGMVRDTEDGKADFTLVFDGPMLTRWAEHLTKGAKKYSPRNWMKASGADEEQRFRKSAARHFVQWMRGDDDEDHAAAVLFNINGVEYVRERVRVMELVQHHRRREPSPNPDTKHSYTACSWWHRPAAPKQTVAERTADLANDWRDAPRGKVRLVPLSAAGEVAALRKVDV